ncbi:globin-like protein [Cryphonectria parasitica EP155]|uniref:nitric oxide dioxygenase n=1 Tax=Cryphonectria parasitica (strain ATCC 38755 / EP155) TaxID=660469 RepID=A0A9P4YB80_CRYP1|nr:globin-like protein [Cryphonectria parasitica EP155]KAF3769707.1 globin-like protein [Cryphonectria parasitica EP155]
MSHNLSYHQMRLVKATIPELRSQGERITEIMYGNMLRAHPELNNMFNSVNQANHRQPRALTSVILAFASAINYDISELIPKLERMCNKHCSLGIKPEHYEIVATYLIDAFSVVLGPAMTPETKEAWNRAYWILAKMLIGREKQLYNVFGPWNGWAPFQIIKKESETDDIVSFYLAPQNKRPLPGFLPGQYISVQVPLPKVGYMQSRQFSLSDAPHEDYYRITIKRESGGQVPGSKTAQTYPVGQMTNYLIDQMNPGDIVDVTHPAGEFYLDTTQSSSVPLVLISAGVGVAPMVSMLNAMMDLQPTREISWIHGARRMIPFCNHVRDAKRRMPNLRTNIFKTHLADGDLAGVTHDYDFRVDLAKVNRDDLHLGHGGAEYYICGPEQFMIEMADYLKMQGVELRRMKFELFSTGDMVEVK